MTVMICRGTMLVPRYVWTCVMRGTVCALATASVGACPLQAVSSCSLHHIHLNEWGQPWIAQFYTRIFDPTDVRREKLFGDESVAFGNTRLVIARPQQAMLSSTYAIWHLGWGHIALDDSYRRHLNQEAQLDTPVVPSRDPFHLHLHSKDGVAACHWYETHFGATCAISNNVWQGEIADERIAPSAIAQFPNVSFAFHDVFDDVELAPSPRHSYDHIAFECRHLEQWTGDRAMRVIDAIQRVEGSRVARIEGPDGVVLELVEPETR
jgi:hypothetical protein